MHNICSQSWLYDGTGPIVERREGAGKMSGNRQLLIVNLQRAPGKYLLKMTSAGSRQLGVHQHTYIMNFVLSLFRLLNTLVLCLAGVFPVLLRHQ